MQLHALGRGSSLPLSSQGKLFAAGPTTRTAAQVTSVQANIAIRLLLGLRRLNSSKLPSYEFNSEI